MNKLSTTGKISLAIQLIAGLIIVILAISNQLIPDVLIWIYVVGVAIAFGGFFTNKNKKH